MEVLIINGHDYSRYVERKGVAWERNDLDGDDSGRTMDGLMHRAKITTKRKLGYKLMHMTRQLMAQLDDDLSEETFSATYLDLHGKQTRTFYCTSFKATTAEVLNEDGDWEEASFNMIEV